MTIIKTLADSICAEKSIATFGQFIIYNFVFVGTAEFYYNFQ